MDFSTSRFRFPEPSPRSPLEPYPSSVLNLRTPGTPSSLGQPAPCFTTPIQRPRTAAATTSKKRKHDENQDPRTPTTDARPIKKRNYQLRRTTGEKLEIVFGSLRQVDWSLGEFLYYVFRAKDEKGEDATRTTSHAMYATNFLQGRTSHTASSILELWFSSPDGRVHAASADHVLMYALSPKYTLIKPARASLSAFAAQTTEKKLVKEARKAVLPTSGLHATSKKRGQHKIEWADVGAATVRKVEAIIKKHQPLTWRLINRIAGGSNNGEVYAIKKRRPPENVCTHVISSLNFTRNNEARLLPLVEGFLYFAFSAPADLMAYASRIGHMPAWSTLYNALEELANHETLVTAAHAQDPSKVGFWQGDNVQNYSKPQEHRIGRGNRMNIGIAATYCELEGVDPAALNLEDRRARILENKRVHLTVDQLVSMIDNDHLNTVFMLHWLRILVHSIPELSKWKEYVSVLFREKAKKLQLPIQATKVHPLASSGKNETVTTELKEAIFDFLTQLGHTEENYTPRLLFAGGDGLTFQKMLELQRYLQFHPDPYQSLEIMEPVLSLWHTEWTDVTRIFETHWDGLLSQDPSSLGHSASKINRSGPSNLKKVDYHPAVDLMYLVLDVRILDCWRNHFKCTDSIFSHFTHLEEQNLMPDIEDLLKAAGKLHRAFSSTHAIYLALDDTTLDSDWSETVPLGSTWTPHPIIPSSVPNIVVNPAISKKPRKKEKPVTRHPNGDRVLANSITFMRDALMSREISYAIAEGDVGRVYEILKVFLFTFAGSTHTKYSTYLLEVVCCLELESSPALRDATLRTTLVNLTGRAGSFTAADLMQEFFNRLLEAIVEKKGVEYGDTFIRQVISRNLHHFARIKLDLRVGVGLSQRSGRHSAPHANPEIRILLDVYHDTELHCRRPGRVYKDDDKDHLQHGITKLRESKLKKWIASTCSTRNLLATSNSSAPRDSRHGDTAGHISESESEDGSDMSDNEDEEGRIEGAPNSLVYGEMVDGELILASMDVMADEIDDLLSHLERPAGDHTSADESGGGVDSDADMDLD